MRIQVTFEATAGIDPEFKDKTDDEILIMLREMAREAQDENFKVISIEKIGGEDATA